eukprot:tig00020562_g11155.t1
MQLGPRTSAGWLAACFALLLLCAEAAAGPMPAALANRASRASYVRRDEAFVTIAANEKYVPTAMVLGYSLLRANATRETVCLITAEVKDRAGLARVFDRVVEVQPISAAEAHSPFGAQQAIAVYTKLRILQLYEYKKIVYIDADAAVLANVDELFGCPAPCGVYDTGLWQVTVLGVTVNGGVLVLRPDKADFDALMRSVGEPWAGELEYADTAPCFLGTQACAEPAKTFIGPLEQALLNRYYNTNFTVLPFFYNFMPLATIPWWAGTRSWLDHPDKVKIVHYALFKPWEPTHNTDPSILKYQSHWTRLEAEMRSELEEKGGDEGRGAGGRSGGGVGGGAGGGPGPPGLADVLAAFGSQL